MTNVYFISGLGADSRVFQNIILPDGYRTIYLDWIANLPGETFESYALRLGSVIEIAKPFILIGLSMGGMLAVEIAKNKSPLKIILISSVASVLELPATMKYAGKLNLHALVPMSLLKNASIMKRFFGEGTKEQKQLLIQVIKDSDPDFVRWAMQAVLDWKNVERPNNLVQIHGTNDKVLPAKYTRPDYLVQGGGHFMVTARAAEINAMLAELLPAID